MYILTIPLNDIKGRKVVKDAWHSKTSVGESPPSFFMVKLSNSTMESIALVYSYFFSIIHIMKINMALFNKSHRSVRFALARHDRRRKNYLINAPKNRS